MEIFDLYGRSIKVTNLTEAIMQASNFSSLKHEDPSYSDFDMDRNKYWLDVYEKLIKLKIAIKKLDSS